MTRDGRLHGWKAIAAYLGRTPRTVQRWKHRGLPVQTVGSIDGSVCAVKAELDRWIDLRRTDQHTRQSNGSVSFRTVTDLPMGLRPGAYVISLHVDLLPDGTHKVRTSIESHAPD